MTDRSVLTAFALFCSLGLFACSWPWPSATVDTQGLGESDIAKLLKDRCCTNEEDQIVREITTVLKKAMVSRSVRAAAESIGFTCEDPPSQMCRYAGEKTYRFYNLPEGHRESGKTHIVTYLIVLPNYDNQDDVRVQQKDTVVP